MSADTQGNDLGAVGVPITGMFAFAPYDVSNVLTKANLGASPVVLTGGYQRAGLFKVDGGPQDSRDDEDPIEFFQKGYLLPGDGTRSFVIGLAEDNSATLLLTEGAVFDANGVFEASSSLPGARVIGFMVTKYRNGKERRRNGVVTVTKIEPDQSERGSVEGKKVTFTWQEDDLFNGAPFFQYGPAVPGTVPGKTGWNVTIVGTPTGGSYRLKLNGFSTPDIAYNAAASAVATALNGLAGVTGLSGISASGTSPIAVVLPSAGVLAAGTNTLTGGSAPGVTVA